MRKTALLLTLLVAVCIAIGIFVAKAGAAERKQPYELLEAQLPSGITLKTANIVQLGDALRVALTKHRDDAVSLLRVSVLLRCRRAALLGADTSSAPSTTPRADVLSLLRIAVYIYPDLAADFINNSMGVCGDVAQAAAKIVLSEPGPVETEYPGLPVVMLNPPSVVFSPVTPVTER